MTLAAMIAVYNAIAPERLAFESGRYTVRLWDGMDGCWCDVVVHVRGEEALRAWMERTSDGTKNIRFGDIDYYRIFPADTHMVWDGSSDREMFR